MTSHESLPVVLCVGGLDPSGCAGIAADITTLQQLDCHVCPMISVSTTQNSEQAFDQKPVEARWLQQQLETLLPMKFACVKLGLLHESHIALLTDFLPRLNCSVVIDPILAASKGLAFHASMSHLSPLIPNSILTPNSAELAQLGGLKALYRLSPKAVVLSDGTHGINLYHQEEQHIFPYTQDPLNYRGTGCTFSSALAACLAHSLPLEQAVASALNYVQNTIAQAYRIDASTLVPKRAAPLPQ